MTLHISRQQSQIQEQKRIVVDEFSFLKAVPSDVIMSPSIEYSLAHSLVPDDNTSGGYKCTLIKPT